MQLTQEKKKLFDGLDSIDEIMNGVTSEDYVYTIEPGDDRFYDYHAEICNNYFPGEDWDWEDVLQYWSVDMIEQAIDAYYLSVEGYVFEEEAA